MREVKGDYRSTGNEVFIHFDRSAFAFLATMLIQLDRTFDGVVHSSAQSPSLGRAEHPTDTLVSSSSTHIHAKLSTKLFRSLLTPPSFSTIHRHFTVQYVVRPEVEV